MQPIEVYTDGSVWPSNPGKTGGWGAVLTFKEYHLAAGGFYDGVRDKGVVTNNIMEVMSVTEALRQIKRPNSVVTVYTDSRYVITGLEKIKHKGKVHTTNSKHWLDLVPLLKTHRVSWVHVPGHAGEIHNELAHLLAFMGARGVPTNELCAESELIDLLKRLVSDRKQWKKHSYK